MKLRFAEEITLLMLNDEGNCSPDLGSRMTNS